MKNFEIMTVSTVLLFLGTLFACADQTTSEPVQQMKQDLQNLSGTYMDLEPYAYGEAFGQRIFTFDKGAWTLRFTLGLDPQLQMPVFEFRTYGTYEVLQPSEVVEHAYNALFLEDAKFLTLKTDNPELIQAFGFAQCDLVPNEERDISQTGCALWAPVEICNEDHDLLSMDEQGGLYFGIRPADNNMCTEDRRPTALTPAVIKR